MQGPRKGEDDRHKLKVALEDLYNGKTCRLAVTRNKVSSCQLQNKFVTLKSVEIGMTLNVDAPIFLSVVDVARKTYVPRFSGTFVCSTRKSI